MLKPLRRVVLAPVLVAILSACTGLPAITATPTPTRTPDIQRSKLDIAYSALVDLDVHNVSSKKVLEAGLDGVRAAVRKLGVKDDVPTPDFQDMNEPLNSEFKKFADAVSQLAAKAPEISPDELSLAAIVPMMRTSPDCHTYYSDGLRVYESRPTQPTGSPSPAPPQGQVIAAPDEAGVQARMLEGGVAYVRWTRFRVDGTYDIRAKVKAVLEKALAAGARAWLFDLRGNPGGNGADVLASYFLNGEPGFQVMLKNGNGGVSSALTAYRLPPQYQLPIAVIQNDRGGSATEVFVLFLKENKRATIVGGRSTGCLGATSQNQMSDGGLIAVAVQEFVGAVSGARYNNTGIPPDIQADDAAAIEVAARHLKERIAQGG